jgi:hypothetical protein
LIALGRSGIIRREMFYVGLYLLIFPVMLAVTAACFGIAEERARIKYERGQAKIQAALEANPTS